MDGVNAVMLGLSIPPDSRLVGVFVREIGLPQRARIGGVAQEVPSSSTSLIDTVLAADTERAALLAEAETATDAHRIGDIQARLNDIDAWSAEARADAHDGKVAADARIGVAILGAIARNGHQKPRADQKFLQQRANALVIIHHQQGGGGQVV